jgi:hypothetical protein
LKGAKISSRTRTQKLTRLLATPTDFAINSVVDRLSTAAATRVLSHRCAAMASSLTHPPCLARDPHGLGVAMLSGLSEDGAGLLHTPVLPRRPTTLRKRRRSSLVDLVNDDDQPGLPPSISTLPELGPGGLYRR